MPRLKKIGKGMPKIENENQFLTSIKGRNSVRICQNLPICNRTFLPNINSHSKFEENWLKMLPAESDTDVLTDGRSDKQTDGRTCTRAQYFEWRVLHNTPHFLKWWGIKRDMFTAFLHCNLDYIQCLTRLNIIAGVWSQGRRDALVYSV